MKKIIVILLVLIAAAAVCFFIFKPKGQVVDKEAQLENRNLQVEFRETGSVSPRNRLEIKPPFAGRIEEILVEEGDKIKKGQIIVRMSSSERAAMLDAARATSEEEFAKWQNVYKTTPIVAPMDGFIILRQNEPGQTISASDAILVMADDLIVESQVDETDLRLIEIGETLKMYLDAYPDEVFSGVIEHISYESTVVSNVTVYTIRIKPVKKPSAFRAGMTATITVTAEHEENAPSLPNNFISEKNGRKTVTVKTGKSGKAAFETRNVTTGISDGRYTKIVSGLKENETVVIFKTSAKQKAKSFMSRP